MKMVHQRRNMLDTMKSNLKGNDHFATKVISTKNVQKNIKEVRRKNQTYFFSKY